VHPIGGGVLCYFHLARALGGERPLYGLQARGLDGREPPLARVEEMAERYLAALAEIQPRGPYLLGGWSFGGVVAFEMARQLAERGEVARLVLFDSVTPAESRRVFGAPDEPAMRAMFAHDLWAQAGRGAAPPAPDDLHRRALDDGLLPVDVGPEVLERLFGVFRANLEAFTRYSPAPHRGEVTLFAASENERVAPARGWAELVSGPLRLKAVAGDHYGLLLPPGVTALAGQLQRILDADPAGV
jgi:thioesterase domain-containing protein